MLTPEQKAELERRGWSPFESCGEFESYINGSSLAYVFADGAFSFYGRKQDAVEFVALASGYRLIPESVAREAAWLLCKMAEGDAPTHFDRTRAPEVAAALRGEAPDYQAGGSQDCDETERRPDPT